MKREYFGMLFILAIAILIITTSYFFGEENIAVILHRFIVIWILIAFQVGQYSMRFPRAF